jgi:DNA invertase Pin-like site-specific DNA recombinase
MLKGMFLIMRKGMLQNLYITIVIISFMSDSAKFDKNSMCGYIRISTNEQHSINQEDKLREFGVTIFFKDEGVSGSKLAMERTDFKEMMKYIKEHPAIKTIVVYELSRLGRNMLDAITMFITLEKQGYRIWSLTEDWTHQDDPSMRSLMLLIVSWMNEMELKRLSQRTKAGMDRVKLYGSKSGKPIGRPVVGLDKDIVMNLRKEGKSWKFIADTFKTDISTLFRYRKNWRRKELGREEVKANT